MESESASSSATRPWHSGVATQLPYKDLLTNFVLRNMLERIRERWEDGGNGALLIGPSVKVLQILKKLSCLCKGRAIPYNLCKCSLCHDTSPCQICLLFEHLLLWTCFFITKDILPGLWCSKDSHSCWCCPWNSSQGRVQPGFIHLELLPQLPCARMQWRSRGWSTGHVLILLLCTGFPLRSVQKEMHLQKVTGMLIGLSSLAGGGVEGSSTVSLGAAVSGWNKTTFRGRDAHGSVGWESQIVLKSVTHKW